MTLASHRPATIDMLESLQESHPGVSFPESYPFPENIASVLSDRGD